MLGNGMAYYVRQNGEPQNRISLRLVVHAGSNMEDDDQRGVAHLVEHVVFDGTEHFGASAIDDYFRSIGMRSGADLNAYTSFDETVYKIEVPADDPSMLETGLLVLRDFACAALFEDAQVDKERGIVTEDNLKDFLTKKFSQIEKLEM